MYQVVSQIVQPSTLFMLLMGAGLIALWRNHDERQRRKLLCFSLLWLVWCAVSTPASQYLVSGTLEWRYPPRYDLPKATKAIVVLGGGIANPDDLRERPDLGDASIARCLKAADLYREHGPCKLIVCGGKTPNDPTGPPLATVMYDFLCHCGVSPDDIILEDRSQTTYENAVEATRLLREHDLDENVVLVTSAAHLNRGVRCFRQLGIAVTPIGCSYRATKFQWRLSTFLPVASSASHVDDVAHEWIGMLWYGIKRRI